VQSHKWFYFIGCHAILKKYSKKIIQTNGRIRDAGNDFWLYFEKASAHSKEIKAIKVCTDITPK
jgi:hypothetical protein